MSAMMPSGLVRALFRSRITSAGRFARISARALSRDLATARVAPICLAVALIFEVKSKSSRIAKITL